MSTLGSTLHVLGSSVDEWLVRARRGDRVAVHRARVASRRLREGLAIAAGIDAGRVTPLRRRIRRVGRALGPIRELQVTVDLFLEEARRHRWPEAAVAPVLTHLEAERVRRRVAMQRRLDRGAMDRPGAEVAGLARVLDQQLAALSDADEAVPSDAHVLRLIVARIRHRAAAFAGAVRAVGPLYAPDALHRARIAGKKLRYALELGRDLHHLPVARDLRALRDSQRQLGRLNDLRALQPHLATVAASGDVDLSVRRALDVAATAIETECRQLHAAFLRRRPALLAIAGRVRLVNTVIARPRARAMREPGARPSARARLAKGA